MKVFISWSEERSHQVAIALAKWLKRILQYVEPFVSSEHIEKGSRWADQLTGALKETQFGIVCVTPENTTKPWLLFEAGALSNAMASGRVAVLLYQCSVSAFVDSPLQQFQATSLDKMDDFRKLVLSINSIWTTPFDQEVINDLLDMVYPKLMDDIKEIPAVYEMKSIETTENEDINTQVLEEILKSTRNTEAMLRVQDDKIMSLHEEFSSIEYRSRDTKSIARPAKNLEVQILFTEISIALNEIIAQYGPDTLFLDDSLKKIEKSIPSKGFITVGQYKEYNDTYQAFLIQLERYCINDDTNFPVYVTIKNGLDRIGKLLFTQ